VHRALPFIIDPTLQPIGSTGFLRTVGSSTGS